MRYLKYPLFLAPLLVAGCAELSSFNDAVGDVAGKLNSVLGTSNSESSSGGLAAMSAYSKTNAYVINDSVNSKKDIDTLYIKIKRAFNFSTKEEALSGTTGEKRRWLEITLEEGGLVHEATPGVYYHMATTYSGENFADVTLEKEGNVVHIRWVTKSNDKNFAPKFKADLIKLIK